MLPDVVRSRKIVIGSRVILRISNEECEEYRLVHPIESDPRSNVISICSPLGVALLGKKKGEKVDMNNSTFYIKNIL